MIILGHINLCPSHTFGDFCGDVISYKCHCLLLGLLDSCLNLTKAREINCLMGVE